jgi:hypothetical protein
MMSFREEMEHFALRAKLLNWLALLGGCLGAAVAGLFGTMMAAEPWYWFWAGWDVLALGIMVIGSWRTRRIMRRLDELEEFIE